MKAKEWLEEGEKLLMLHRYEEGLRAYEEAIRLDPNLALAYYCKGLVLRNLGRDDEAQRAFEKAKQLGYP